MITFEPTDAEKPDLPNPFNHRLTTAVAELKVRLQARYQRRVPPDKMTLVRAALDEAEALAWRTGFPHLFLPGLAEEGVARFAICRSPDDIGKEARAAVRPGA
jgi:hypothetical protein